MKTIVLSALSLVWFMGVAFVYGEKLVFEETFDGDSLDLDKWEYQEDNCDDRFGQTLNCYSQNNVAVHDGNLVITAKKEQMNNKEFTSGRIRMKGSGFEHGRFEVEARMARGDHLWPALWLLPLDNNCRYEEIDMAEYRGQAQEANNVEVAAHWGRAHDQSVPKGIKVTDLPDLSAGFHKYTLRWFYEKLEWYIDDVKVFEATDAEFLGEPSKQPCDQLEKNPFIQRSNFIFNMAVGGPFFVKFPPPIPDTTTWSKPTMEVSSVRIYQE